MEHKRIHDVSHLTHSAFTVACLTLLAACGGGSNGDSVNNLSPSTGSLLDAPIAGMEYETETQSGVTDINGHYLFLPEETVEFSIGALKFPTIAASTVVTPLQLFDTTDMNDRRVVNALRFLQSIDASGNPAEGISISALTKSVATPLNFDVDPSDFESLNGSALTTILHADGLAKPLISENTAREHFERQLLANSLTREGLSLRADPPVGRWFGPCLSSYQTTNVAALSLQRIFNFNHDSYTMTIVIRDGDCSDNNAEDIISVTQFAERTLGETVELDLREGKVNAIDVRRHIFDRLEVRVLDIVETYTSAEWRSEVLAALQLLNTNNVDIPSGFVNQLFPGSLPATFEAYVTVKDGVNLSLLSVLYQARQTSLAAFFPITSSYEHSLSLEQPRTNIESDIDGSMGAVITLGVLSDFDLVESVEEDLDP